jgi:hypothetical protein
VRDKEFLVPALRAAGNLVTACDGKYVAWFLEQSTTFVDCLNLLLEQSIAVDAVTVASYVLLDAGLPEHASTRIAVPAFLPRLLPILTSESTRFEWKREAVCAICNAVVIPPPFVDSVQEKINGRNLSELLRTYVWNAVEPEHLFRSLVELIKSPDCDAVVAAMNILDRVLREFEGSRPLFESCGGVDTLEYVCEHASELDVQFRLASGLIDDVFDVEDHMFVSDTNIAPMIANNSFVFGAHQTQIEKFAFGSSGEASAPQGRGRGRTIPAWMQE